MKWMKFFVLLIFSISLAYASEHPVTLKKAHINLHDKASLQRGAKFFTNYCSGCHSLEHVRFSRTGKDIGLTDKTGAVNETLVKQSLIFGDQKIGDQLNIAMTPANANLWFGVVPPDLSVISRVRGADWLYTYLLSFYKDETRPLGTNNRLFKDVAMPNVFALLQGEQIPVYRTETVPYNGDTREVKLLDHLQIISDGMMSQPEFESSVRDIVNFLSYVGEPIKVTRVRTGLLVWLFLILFLVVAYQLKKEYWRDIK